MVFICYLCLIENNPRSHSSSDFFPRKSSANTAASTWLSAPWSGKYFTRAAAAFTGNGRGNSLKFNSSFGLFWTQTSAHLQMCASVLDTRRAVWIWTQLSASPLVSSLSLFLSFLFFFLFFFFFSFKAPLLQKLSNGQGPRHSLKGDLALLCHGAKLH